MNGYKGLSGQITKMHRAKYEARLLEGNGRYPQGRSLRRFRIIRDDGVSVAVKTNRKHS